jgi:hypothetical protein
MKEITLTIDLVNAIISYLGTRPYGEVYQLIAEVQRQAAPQVPAETEAEVTA